MTEACGDLIYPFPNPPAAGELKPVAPGVLWLRLPLPFRLNHINVYLIEDDDGWAVLDAGISNNETREIWGEVIANALPGCRLTRLIVTHFHPDHIGSAGWLCERLRLPLLTSQTSYLGCLNISLNPGALDARTYREFYLRHGLDPAATELVATQGHQYLRMVDRLPQTFERLVDGDTLRIGTKNLRVLTGDGHAPEQIMLYEADGKLLFAADQVLSKISPNVSVWAVDPNGDPLGLYLRSLARLSSEIPEDVIVLPGHQLPFYGLHRRISQLAEHHEQRCQLIADACRQSPSSATDLVPVLFMRELDPHQMSFAFSEAQAHINYMIRRGRLRWSEPGGGVERVVSAASDGR